MLQPRLRTRLIHQPLHQGGVVGQLASQKLQRDGAVERQIVGQIHAAHPPFAKQATHFEVIDVLADEGIQPLVFARHGRTFGIVRRGGECAPGARRLLHGFGLGPSHACPA